MSDTTGSKVANSVALTLISRFAMIAATLALPIVGWMVQRGVSTGDVVAEKIDRLRDQSIETNGTVKLIQQTQAVQGASLTDHESRIRIQENLNRMLLSNPPIKP